MIGWIMFPLLQKNGEIKTGHFSKFFKEPPLYPPPYLKKDASKDTTIVVNFSIVCFKYNADSLPYLYEKIQNSKKSSFKF